jgi:lysozyme
MKKVSLFNCAVITLLSSCTSLSNNKNEPQIVSDTLATEVPVVVVDTVPVLGIDVSHFQGDIDWGKIKDANIKFAYSKATQGTHFQDPRFKTNWKNSQDAGLASGAYHFYKIGEDVEEQARSFIKVVGQLVSGDMLPMLDLEQGSIKSGTKVDVATFQKNVMIWLKMVEDSLGVQPIIYTNNPFANAYLINPKFSKYKLWLAEYGVSKPKTPKTWSATGWTIWQRSARGSIEGEIGNVDHDILKGFENELSALKIQ